MIQYIILTKRGCTANGYNFRIDILRALGNGVVPQTAELAFKILLNKFFKQNKYYERV
jgi:hypothetical protein